MAGGYAYGGYSRLIGLGEPTLQVNGFSIENVDLPSNVFYNRHKTPQRAEDFKVTGMTEEPTVEELEEDQKELYDLYKSGQIGSVDYQREWQMLESQIKELRNLRS